MGCGPATASRVRASRALLSDAAASPEEPPLVGTSLLPRLALTLAHQLAVASGGGGGGGLTLSLWWRLFLWTQAFEVPVYGQLLLASPAGAGEMARALAVGAAASALTHPAACILYVLLLRQRLALAPPAWPLLRSAEGWAHWLLVEAIVVAVEARWLRARGARDPWWASSPSPTPRAASEGGRSPDFRRLYLA